MIGDYAPRLGNSLIFTYFVFSPYLLMMDKQVSVRAQHLWFGSHGAEGDFQMQVRWQKNCPVTAICKLQDQNLPTTTCVFGFLVYFRSGRATTEDCLWVSLLKGTKKEIKNVRSELHWVSRNINHFGVCEVLLPFFLKGDVKALGNPTSTPRRRQLHIVWVKG